MSRRLFNHAAHERRKTMYKCARRFCTRLPICAGAPLTRSMKALLIVSSPLISPTRLDGHTVGKGEA